MLELTSALLVGFAIGYLVGLSKAKEDAECLIREGYHLSLTSKAILIARIRGQSAQQVLSELEGGYPR